MTHEYKHPKYWAALRKLRLSMKPGEEQPTSKQIQTSKQQAHPTHNQQASKVSSTVDQDPGAMDEQA